MKPRIRLIRDKARSGALNMALDELLMESQRLPGAAPALRFYSWIEPTITVGYFQDPAAVARRFHAADRGVPVIRRVTGGGTVFHGEDLTLSLALPSPNVFLPADVKASYLAVNEALMRGLRPLFPALDFADCKSVPSARAKGDRVCFENPSCYDLMLEGRKVVGSSQRRSEGRLLHQAAVFFKAAPDALVEKILEGFRSKWGVDFFEEPFGVRELETASQAAAVREASSAWTLRPQPAVRG